jgi:predicted nucleic acid-binding protein
MSSLDLAMRAPRVYLDTSVLGGCFEPEFEEWSNGLVEDFRRRRFVPVLSDLLAAELDPAPERVRQVHAELIEIGAEGLVVGEEALDLLDAYEARAVLGAKYRNDMLHIALATTAKVDVLVSWNFKHMVRFEKIRLFNAVNLDPGYKSLTIHSPREVATHGKNRDQRR